MYVLYWVYVLSAADFAFALELLILAVVSFPNIAPLPWGPLKCGNLKNVPPDIFFYDGVDKTQLFKKYDVITLRLDWTKPNDEIKNFLVKNSRFGIPFNKIYGPLMPNGRILPELLSVKLIREHIENAK